MKNSYDWENKNKICKRVGKEVVLQRVTNKMVAT